MHWTTSPYISYCNYQWHNYNLSWHWPVFHSSCFVYSIASGLDPVWSPLCVRYLALLPHPLLCGQHAGSHPQLPRLQDYPRQIQGRIINWEHITLAWMFKSQNLGRIWFSVLRNYHIHRYFYTGMEDACKICTYINILSIIRINRQLYFSRIF